MSIPQGQFVCPQKWCVISMFPKFYGSSLKIGRFHTPKSLISRSYSPGQTVAIGLTGWVFEVLGVTEGLGVIYLYINPDLMQILFTP